MAITVPGLNEWTKTAGQTGFLHTQAGGYARACRGQRVGRDGMLVEGGKVESAAGSADVAARRFAERRVDGRIGTVVCGPIAGAGAGFVTGRGGDSRAGPGAGRA